ncbi:DUF2867 domain-containing protein [Streptomyces sp. 15-116A]|uniref:DUF2867 domain-containing protein n=1 Tax=Streptomyces sp. 15-116A TaxID=2259035 RepID=UPI0021B419A7|nr:DUF2867 domain-containing protein [Streptomyces sp. 15-116A]MCT7353583.1 DUF2867 domain-containing protein [Streptomyces sp. 15-116A]
MRLASTAHTSRPWRIHEIAGDFRLEDVWALPTPGGPDDLPYLVEQIAGGDEKAPSPVYRALFALRWRLGRLFGWDKDGGGRGPSLRDRLPADLRDAPRGPDVRSAPFTSVYQLHDEWAAEIANRTVHAVMHIGWVQDGTTGAYRGQMAVLVKPNGLFGSVYMLGIKPFRYVGVYPALLRAMGRKWQATAGRRGSAA